MISCGCPTLPFIAYGTKQIHTVTTTTISTKIIKSLVPIDAKRTKLPLPLLRKNQDQQSQAATATTVFDGRIVSDMVKLRKWPCFK